MRKSFSSVAIFGLVVAVNGCATLVTLPRFEATEQTSGLESRLQAVYAVDGQVVWASGLQGGIVRTEDGGETWQILQVPDADELQFRDIHAFGPSVAYLLSSGDGDLSRIYKTSDGGDNWTLQFLNREAKGFLDCFDFWDSNRGVVYGDSVNGVLVVLMTSDGGATWDPVSEALLPSAGLGEGGFAASGTCVETGSSGSAWIGTGAGGTARILRTRDGGSSWSEVEAPVVKGQAAGVMSIRMNGHLGLVLGGDLEQMDRRTANVALTQDAGATWQAGGELHLAGPAYGGAWGGTERNPLLFAACPCGLYFSFDRGKTWHSLSKDEYWSVDFGISDRFWAVGPEGRITRFDMVADTR